MRFTRPVQIALASVVGVLLVGGLVFAARGGYLPCAAAMMPAASACTGASCTMTDHSACAQSATCPQVQAESCCGAAAQATAPAVDPSACVGCGACAKVAPDAFRMNGDTHKAEVRDAAPAESVARGAQVCPTHAVSQ